MSDIAHEFVLRELRTGSKTKEELEATALRAIPTHRRGIDAALDTLKEAGTVASDTDGSLRLAAKATDSQERTADPTLDAEPERPRIPVVKPLQLKPLMSDAEFAAEMLTMVSEALREMTQLVSNQSVIVAKSVKEQQRLKAVIRRKTRVIDWVRDHKPVDQDAELKAAKLRIAELERERDQARADSDANALRTTINEARTMLKANGYPQPFLEALKKSLEDSGQRMRDLNRERSYNAQRPWARQAKAQARAQE